jgi:hypothetical protein
LGFKIVSRNRILVSKEEYFKGDIIAIDPDFS